MVACGAEDVDVSPQTEGTVISIELSDSRTSLGESVDGARSVYWSSGDRIAANGEVSGEAQFSGEKPTSASFSFAATLGYPRNILYPASFYTDDSTITLLRVQDFAEGTVATNTLPMATKVENMSDAVRLHHLAAVVHLQLKASPTTGNNAVRKVEIRGRRNEQMSGGFTIDYATSTLTPTVFVEPTATNTENILALVAGSRVLGELSTDTVTDVFVVVPAQEYADGFTVRVINELGHYMDKNTSGVTLTNGEIYKLPPFEYIPTGTIVKVEL
jgi:hypothetical protein